MSTIEEETRSAALGLIRSVFGEETVEEGGHGRRKLLRHDLRGWGNVRMGSS